MVWAYFIVKDAIAAFDGDPTTATASQKIQEWKRKRGMRGTVFLGLLILLLALAGTCFIILSTWLFFHLVQEAL